MSDSSSADRVAQLRDEIRRHDRLYFVDAAPEISDSQYDTLMRELRDLEVQHPDLITDDSPTQRVGERLTDGFDVVTHAQRMMSIDNTYAPEELADFDRRVRKELEREHVTYVVDPKIDGVAVSLRYESGRLATAATRGDGAQGDDITANVKPIRSVPLRLDTPTTLHESEVPTVLEVRGEIYWPRERFDQHNQLRIERGEEPFANPRNATSGTLKQHEPKLVAQRGLAFTAHGFGVIDPFPTGIETHIALFELLRAAGIPISAHLTAYPSIEAVVDDIPRWDALRHTLSYETDGLVIRLDDLAARARLGTTSKAPRWCIAYKFAAEQAQTILEAITVQVGKLGTITPVANLRPVQLAGTTVKRASLHNFDQLERLDVRIGDTVRVEKAGEIIPQVVSVVDELRPQGATPFSPPRDCPQCSTVLVREAGEVALRCPNFACPAQRVERLRFFAGRNQMDIDGLGSKLVEQLVDAQLIAAPQDIYRLHQQRDTLRALERMGDKSVEKLLTGIEASKQRPFSRVIASLNVRLVGLATAELITEVYPNVAALTAASEEDLQSIDGVGPEVAHSLHAWLNSDLGRATLAALADVGVNLTEPPRAAREADDDNHPFAGKTFVVTGTLEKFGRKDVEAHIKRLGGKVASSVSRKTDFLIAGARAGSKLERAEALDVPVLSEQDFEQRLSEADDI